MPGTDTTRSHLTAARRSTSLMLLLCAVHWAVAVAETALEETVAKIDQGLSKQAIADLPLK